MPTFFTGDVYSVMVNFGAGGGFIKLPEQTGFTYQENVATPSVDAFTTGVSTQIVHKNWSGSIDFAQTDNTADSIRDGIQAAFQAGASAPLGSISVARTNLDGSVTNYNYPNVTFAPGGVSVMPSKEIGEKIAWACPLRNKS
jgi:hypothetical protein